MRVRHLCAFYQNRYNPQIPLETSSNFKMKIIFANIPQLSRFIQQPQPVLTYNDDQHVCCINRILNSFNKVHSNFKRINVYKDMVDSKLSN